MHYHTDQRQDWKQRHGEICKSEQYVKCALPTCLVRVLVGYTDPSRPFQANEDTTLRSTLIDASSGSAVVVLRYFCSQSHCEEGKEAHEMTIKEHNLEMARKERELSRKFAEYVDENEHFKKKCNEWNLKIGQLNEGLKHDTAKIGLALEKFLADVYKSELPPKEMEVIRQREIANHHRMFRKKELEYVQKIQVIRARQTRELESLNVQHCGFIEVSGAFYREKYAGDEEELQKQLMIIRDNRENANEGLLIAREKSRSCEEDLMKTIKELDAINADMDGSDKSAPTAATSDAADSGPMKTPTEQTKGHILSG